MKYVVLVCFLLLRSFASEAQTSGATSLSQEKHEPVVQNSEPPDAPSSTSLAKQDTFAWSLTEPTKQANTAPKPAPIWDKPMWAATIFQAGATIFDIEMTHEGIAHHKCVEGNLSLARHPSRSELYLDNLEEFAPVVVINGKRASSACGPRTIRDGTGERLGYFSPVYGSTIHLRGGIHWYTRCW